MTNFPTTITFQGFQSHQQVACAWAVLAVYLDEPRGVGPLFRRIEEYPGKGDKPGFSIVFEWKHEQLLNVTCEVEG